MLAQMQYQNQIALQQAMMQPYWSSPVMGAGTAPLARTFTPPASQPPPIEIRDNFVGPEVQPGPKVKIAEKKKDSDSSSNSDESSDDVSPTPEGKPDNYGGFTIGDEVMRKSQKCKPVDIDFSADPPDAIIRMRNGRQIVTEFEALSHPKKVEY